jgi:hypothetical protein
MGALPDIQSGLPFPLLGVDGDNDSGFINYSLLSWCDTHRITFIHTRPYKKNDACFAEGKNRKRYEVSLAFGTLPAAPGSTPLRNTWPGRSLPPSPLELFPAYRQTHRQDPGGFQSPPGNYVSAVYDNPRIPYQRLPASPGPR